jgi:hypothetical protein
MASVYKRKRLEPLPDGAVVVTRKGRQKARWKDGDDKTRTAPVTVPKRGKLAGQTCIVTEPDRYTVVYTDETTRRRTVTAYTDKAASERLAHKLEDRGRQRRDGLIDAKAEAFATQERRPLTEHLDEWFSALVARGNTERYANGRRAQAQAVIESRKARRISDLVPSRVQAAIKARIDAGCSLRTANAYLSSIKGFSRWLW